MEPIREREQPQTDWNRFWRVNRAFYETDLISGELCAFVETLLSIQGMNTDCFPTTTDLARKFGNQKRAIRLIRLLESELPEIARVQRVGGSGANRYGILPKDKWPLDLILKWEQSKLHKWDGRPTQRRRQRIDSNAPKTTTRNAPKTTARKPSTTSKTTALLGDSMGVDNGIASKAVNIASTHTENAPCANPPVVHSEQQKTYPDLWAGF